MNKTKIEWCDMTWNPVTGCLHGCEYCYAKKIANRFGHGDSDGGEHDLHKPIVCKSVGRIDPYPYKFDPTFHRYKLNELQKIKKPKTIFVCSMADLFGEWVPDEWIEKVFDACEKAPQHKYLFLTKNPLRYARLYERGKLPAEKNMWYGTSITNRDQMEIAKSAFGKLPLIVRTFFSVEPILENIAYTEAFEIAVKGVWAKWIIIGAETGNQKDKVIPQKYWIDEIADNANKYSIPVFMKDSLVPIVGEENMRREFPW